ncbi:biotin/lipoyl-containing protein [Novosphingobium sp. 9U]|uniref:acetyl-CoA carboxylase biotin carboxyl carrier protein n=1 Tax=Novosphingobium sp. 9U TaxID=2653158 RepID=UPI0012F02CDB|nr:biotin/lipoyl-containing protein [Novosphingobium sp. 9U]VWX47327.1 Biotin carboxyl carrier protein of acetyl-CoA carboxylase [Novosphingobium sp. 9U]
MSGNDDQKSTAPELGEFELLVEEFRTSGLRELHARCGELEVYLSHDSQAPGLDGARVSVSAASAAPAIASPNATAPVAAAPMSSNAAPTAADGEVFVNAPYLGTFYRSPKPGAAPYVEVGATVSAETEVCLVEVMKLFTAVRAGAPGKIVRVLANDGDLVPAGQPLFVIQKA